MPRLSERYGAALYELTKDLDDERSSRVVAEFVDLLAARNELPLAPRVLEAYARAAREGEGVTDVRLTTADALTKAQQTKLAKALSEAVGGPVEIETRTDPALIAGAVIRYADTLIDASLQGKLDRLKRQLAA